MILAVAQEKNAAGNNSTAVKDATLSQQNKIEPPDSTKDKWKNNWSADRQNPVMDVVGRQHESASGNPVQ